MADDEEVIPYEVQRDPAWLKEVESWTWEPLGDGSWMKGGRCTVCGHAMRVKMHGGPVVIPLDEPGPGDEALLVRAIKGPLLVTPASGEKKLFASCDCGEKHSGRPEDVKAGCGACGDITPPLKDDDD
jgi:hypothetical protein